MKKLFLFFALIVGLSYAVEAQKISRWGMICYSKYAPEADNDPAEFEAHAWFCTGNSTLYLYNRTTKAWEAVPVRGSYGELSISNDTTSLSFAATTAQAVKELTAGQLSGFAMVGDSALQYNGLSTGRFLLNYSLTTSFAEAANLVTAYPVIGTTTVLRMRSRQTVALTTDKVQLSSSGIITLSPGQIVKVRVVPATHTGTDILQVLEANINISQL